MYDDLEIQTGPSMKNVATATKTKIPLTKKSLPPLPKRQIHPIIEIVNGSKHYGFCGHWREVLRKFNMTVYEGEVYALLGPHGCGKSTVLNVILGLKALDIGQVKIFGLKPGHELSGIPGVRVGYTPQSSGLYQDFTISETLRYYGVLHGLKWNYISQRISFLSNLLNIPQDAQFMQHCTEGTKRQVSLAVALLHEPEVLILDEPCSGIDPVLRRSMLEHLRLLAKQDKTILITTQSCEEARMADKIGFMRHGHLLIDGNPRQLLTGYGEKLLESLYRRVYSSNIEPQKSSTSLEENPIIKLEPLNVTSSEGFVYTGDDELSSDSIIRPRMRSTSLSRKLIKGVCSGSCSFRRLGVLIICDFTRSIRKYIWLFLFLLLPSLFVLVFCSTIGTTPSSLELAVVNYEASEEDCLVDYELYLSCQVLNLIDRDIVKQREFETTENAIKAAKNLEVLAVLVIDSNFSGYINKMYAQVVLGKNDYTIDQAPMTLSLDLTSKIVANTIEHIVKEAILKYMLQATKGTKVEGAGVGYPMKMGLPIYGSDTTTDTEYMAPGLIVMFTYHMAAFVAAITLVTDRVNKLTQRNYLAGVHLRETVLSQMVVYGLIILLQTILLFCVILLIFDMPNNGNLWYIMLIILVQIWCGISFGVLIAMISRTTVGAGVYVFCCIVTTLFLCGIQWPLNGLPRWLYLLIEFLPQTKSIDAVRSILQRGTDITHKIVWLGIAVPACWLWIFTIAYTITNKII